MPQVYLGLGSNLGDRSLNLAEACQELGSTDGIEILKMSTVEETDPVDFLEQPDFFNQVILVRTNIKPLKLLKIAKSIEKKMGRKKTIPKGPRIIDIDILLYGDSVLESDTLTIPHPEIRNRDFVLKHLIEITPDLTDPATGKPYSEYYNKLTNC
ncbi:MAG: 2-amino-4-hydroxy-6-hydroxymethyldihydropteridine diphosphokinase [Spirochaetes bacterium]|nr:2-amino-4-hydroxy-6-hydroxymethyldihydropteridine diphosphokinase [Spirochaetota bacterium]